MVRTFAALASLLLPTSVSAADANFADAAKRLAPNVSAAGSCSLPDGSGHFRTVVFSQGFEHVSSEVYLQWLEWDEGGARLLKSVLVAELSSGFWSVGKLSVISRKTCSMRLDATHTYSSEAARFVLRPRANGKYSLQMINARERP